MNLKIIDTNEKEHTSWELSGTFELEGKEYEATIYWDDSNGYSLDAWKEQHNLIEHLKRLNMTADDFCSKIDEMYEEEMYE